VSDAPRATYRLQLGPELTFADARRLVPYLRELGVSHLYLSPSLQARSGSTHGYDVVDPTTVSRELGGEEELRRLAGEGLGIVLDIVPNHMGTGDENRWWVEDRERVFDVNPETGFYRRFFDIDDLAAVRMERDDVFELVHGKVLELMRDGVLDGLRVDHPDGLADPAGYLARLREAGAEHVWVEKILHPGEALRDWPVDGTVGYEFLNEVLRVFVDPAAEEPLTELWREIAGDARPFSEVAYEAQLEQATTTFSREVEWLRSLADLPRVAETLAALPIYRTYVEPWSGRVEDEDVAAVDAAAPPDELRRALLLESGQPTLDEFVTRFQQTSPPVTAKGVEDTAFYRYNRLVALNEVGGDPGQFALTVDEFHALNAERARRWPHGLLTLSTHDTKRSADARARIGALAGMAGEWREHVLRWRELNSGFKHDGAPDANEEYLLYQTLAGAWPITRERLDGYLEKALREAKRNTNWVEQDHDYERRVQEFAAAVIEHEPFLADFGPFAERVAVEGERVALGHVLLMLTSPGVPVIYQGDELSFLYLVDPDNRRPVDWAAREGALERVRGGAPPDRSTRKLFVIWKALALRERRPEAFAAGAYTPVDAGPGVVAFTRGDDDVLVVVPVRDWEDAQLTGPGGGWRSVFTGEEMVLDAPVGVADLVAPQGVGLFERV
jgi:(1->4)-alpha-D-glucan 1-alpha-D-glucosylmutase